MFRSNLKFIGITLFLFFLHISAGAQNLSFLGDSTEYLWPTNASTYLTSTFAETRSAHLHSGIDIRTWGREGYEVYASRDGKLSRVGVSPSGYGNVIYLQHPDESYTVYAHLNRFEENLQQYVDSIRTIDYTFELDDRPQHEVHYKKGDLIGYTGSTGVGPPHLHFEIRTPDNEPVNPLLTNLKSYITDTLPPVFSALAIEWLHPKSLHHQGHQIISPLASDSTITDFGRIFTSNPVGLALDVYDGADRTSNVYAVHQLLMTVDDDTLFSSKANQFSFPEDQMMYLDRSYPILAQLRRGFQRLYIVNGNRLPFYKKNRGVIALDKGEHEVNIIARDIYGNESHARLRIFFEEDHKIDSISSVPAYPSPKKFADIPKSGISVPLSPRKTPRYYLTEQFEERNQKEVPYESVFYYYDDLNLLEATLSSGKRATVHSLDQTVSLQIPPSALYDSLKIKMRIGEYNGYPAFEFSPNRLPIQNSMAFRYQLPDHLVNDSQIGLYSYDEFRNRYSFLNSSIRNGILRAELKEFSELRIRKDIYPPFV
ncbi:MAG: M23 family metallopeptidase, partial [Balneolaceae bacterium]